GSGEEERKGSERDVERASVCPDLAGKPKIFFCPGLPRQRQRRSVLIYRDPYRLVASSCRPLPLHRAILHREGTWRRIMMRVKRHMTEKPYEFRERERRNYKVLLRVAQTGHSSLGRSPLIRAKLQKSS
uniref:NTR domain-containing protein n=1 Tax=Macrostomum lignano TaxID=282301 RepID=A0A1I8ITM5_9PLAT